MSAESSELELGREPLSPGAYVDVLAGTGIGMVCVLDREGRIVIFDSECERITGHDASEVVGRDAREVVIPPEESEAFGQFIRDVWETHSSSPQIGHWLTREGERRLIAWSSRPIKASDGDAMHLLTVGIDLTEREQASEELRRLHHELEQRARELAELAGEQSALRRVALLVAGEASPGHIFEAVSIEVAALVGADTAAVMRYEDDDEAATFVGRWSTRPLLAFPTGSRLALSEDSSVARVYRTGAPARLVYAESPSEISTVMIEHGYHCAASAPVIVAGRMWGAIVVVGAGEDPLPAGTTERRLAAFAELLALALAGADAREQLLASRTRLIQVADEERRRLERDLHDGAQQRLVTMSQRLYLADKFLGDDPAKAREQLEICREEAREAIEDLRRLARGLHPPLLTEAGVAPAVRAIADRFHLPVTFSVLPTERFEAAVETAAYYLVSESLTNAGKHADATEIEIAIRRHPRRLVVQVSDDGVGGARPAGGGGLRGLIDRVEALGGNLSITSVPTRGTTVRAELPLSD